MKRKMISCALVLWSASVAFGQADQDKGLTDEGDPKLASWKWAAELKLPDRMDGPYVVLTVPSTVFGKAQAELRDVRLADAQGTRLPYVLRVLRDEAQKIDVRQKRTFNAGPKAKTFEMSIELTDVPAPGHNEIEIETVGRNFRRKLEVLGDDSDKFANPQQLLDKNSFLVHFDVDKRLVESRRFAYDFKQFRFLKVIVHGDASTAEEPPKISRVTVRQTIMQKGEYVTEHAMLEDRQNVRGQGGPGSAWFVTLSHRMPVEKLVFETHGGRLSAGPILLELANPDQPRVPLFIRDWRWRRAKADEKAQDGKKDDREPGDFDRLLLEINFDEVMADRLRLTVTDFANEPLNLSGNVQAIRAERRLMFEKPDLKKRTLPIKLSAGNEGVGAPNYELAGRLPAFLKPAPAAASLGDLVENPAYTPPTPPLHVRLPWLVYVVLSVACAILLVILAMLACAAMRRHDQSAKPESAPA